MTARPAPLRRALCAAAVALALAPALLTSCKATTRKHPQTKLVQANNESDLWASLISALRKERFKMSPSGADETGRVIETGWFTSLAPYKGAGYRLRGHAKYRKVAPDQVGEVPEDQLPAGDLRDDLEFFLVTIRVEKERNDSMRGLQPEYAKWMPEDDDPNAAKRVLLHLESRLGSEAFQLGEKKRDPRREALGIE